MYCKHYMDIKKKKKKKIIPADTNVGAIDAFCLSWKNKLVYLFPPYSMLLNELQNFQEDNAQSILKAPLRKNQTWYSKMVHM